uniref:Uncharacterized protein n=1 Tax=Parascaris equorum TaxID=6256 RepID=A0A914S9D7_PAREQ
MKIPRFELSGESDFLYGSDSETNDAVQLWLVIRHIMGRHRVHIVGVHFHAPLLQKNQGMFLRSITKQQCVPSPGSNQKGASAPKNATSLCLMHCLLVQQSFSLFFSILPLRRALFSYKMKTRCRP